MFLSGHVLDLCARTTLLQYPCRRGPENPDRGQSLRHATDDVCYFFLFFLVYTRLYSIELEWQTTLHGVLCQHSSASAQLITKKHRIL